MPSTLPERVYRGVHAVDRRADRRERLIDAGLALYGTRGYHRTTVRELCAEAKLTERYFYESFGDREELVVAVFERVAAEMGRAMESAVAAAPPHPLAKARAAIMASVTYLTDDPRRARLLLAEATGASRDLDRRRRETIREYARIVRRTAREHFGDAVGSPTDAELTSLAIVASLAALIMEWLQDNLSVSRERLIDHCAALVLAVAPVTSEQKRGFSRGPRSGARENPTAIGGAQEAKLPSTARGLLRQHKKDSDS